MSAFNCLSKKKGGFSINDSWLVIHVQVDESLVLRPALVKMSLCKIKVNIEGDSMEETNSRPAVHFGMLICMQVWKTAKFSLICGHQ